MSNLSRGQTEYCHVNTTPHMPVRRAIRASMSLPILWQPIELFPGEVSRSRTARGGPPCAPVAR